jgi:protein subunit release factor A
MKTETITLELRSAEGGDDSKLLVRDMAAMYIKAARYNNFVVSNEH